MARSGKNPQHPGKPPRPPHKLVIVNPTGAGKVKTHIRRVPQTLKPPIVAADDLWGAPPGAA